MRVIDCDVIGGMVGEKVRTVGLIQAALRGRSKRAVLGPAARGGRVRQG